MHSKRILVASTVLSLAGALACGGGSGGGGGSTYAISGTIVGASAVTVTLSGASTATVTTDGSGNYSIGSLANGSYTLTPSKSGFAFSPGSLAVTVSGADVTGRNFTASAVVNTYSISGAVTGASDVTLTLGGSSTGTTTTDGNGSFSFSGLANGSYTVTPSKDEYTFSPTSVAVTVQGADVTGQDFTATEVVHTYTISGEVAGAAGVTLALSGASTGIKTTDADGKYSFTEVEDGDYTVTPSKDGYTFSPPSSDVTVSGANATVSAFTATLITYEISGTVTGASGVTVTLSGAKTAIAITEGDGSYRFEGLETGHYTVTPGKDQYAFTPEGREIDIDGGDATADFEATLITYKISGTVSTATGALPGVAVSLTGDGTGDVTTNEDGYYEFHRPNGNYTVTPTLPGYTFDPGSLSVPVDGGEQAGKNFTASVVTYTISGTVSSAGGALPGVAVSLSGAGTGETSTDNQGRYSFPGLASGAYTVTPSRADYAFDPINVTVSYADMPGQNVMGTPVGQTFAISGTVRDAEAAAMPGVTVSLSGAITAYATTGADGNYTFPGLVDGSYRVTPSKSNLISYQAWSGYAFSLANLDVLLNGAEVTGRDFRAGKWVLQHGGTVPGPVTTQRLNGIWGDWAVGRSNTLLHWAEGSWTKVTSPVPGTTTQLNSIWGSGPTDIWAVGDGGTILHNGNGTDTGWVDVSAPDGVNRLTTSNLFGVSGIGSELWIVGSNSTILRRTGGAWVSETSPDASITWKSVWVGAASDVWFVGSGGNVYQWDGTFRDRGKSPWGDNWTSNTLNSVWGSGPSDVWMVGGPGDILHWDGSGDSVSWARGVKPREHVTSSFLLSSIWGSGPNDVWVGGMGPVILHWDGRGFDAWDACDGEDDTVGLACAAWKDVTRNGGDTRASTATINGIWGSSATDVRAVGNSGTILVWQ